MEKVFRLREEFIRVLYFFPQLLIGYSPYLFIHLILIPCLQREIIYFSMSF